MIKTANLIIECALSDYKLYHVLTTLQLKVTMMCHRYDSLSKDFLHLHRNNGNVTCKYI